MPKISLTTKEFDALSSKLEKELKEKLKNEVEPDEFSVDYSKNPSSGTDLWELPEVPSKAVVKLSSVVKEILGTKLPTKLIRSGGYSSIEEAIGHLIRQLRGLCQSEVKAA